WFGRLRRPALCAKKARRTVGGLPFFGEVLLILLKAFLRGERGATAIEYGLIVAAIALAIVIVVFTMGDELVAMTDDIITYIQGREEVT
ncbi:MAG TPA: Flp family type IVb pilin, partial [Alphaproteobacteria bacterium]|nr:Flp family type IVb pilin [Alphaproteobacteria bacterium]